jgi:glycosyltransferase involved in cell wall biosynthesis
VKKRILQLTGSFYQGGSERQAAALAWSLKADGKYDIYLATLNGEGVLRNEVNAAGFKDIPEFPLTSFYNANFVKQVRRCVAFLREHQISLIHTHDFYTNIFGMAAASLAGTKAKVASKRETGGMRSSSQGFVEKMAFGRADVIVANSEAVRRHLVERGIATGKINVIYNGLVLDRFENAKNGREQFGLPTDEKIRFITLVANLRHAVKNVPMFLRMAKRVAASVPNTHFVIAGEGELRSELEAMSAELGIAERVHFVGSCDDVPALLNASYACVLTSSAEGFANSILEYMAAAKPVVATNVGGAAEAIIDGQTGYLVDSSDAESMGERLIELLNDKATADDFGTEGKGVAAQKFSCDAQLQNTLVLYDSLLKG